MNDQNLVLDSVDSSGVLNLITRFPFTILMAGIVIWVGVMLDSLTFSNDRSSHDADVTLIDRRNFHLFQPLLFQVATGALSPANIASPLRAIFSRQKNLHIVMGKVASVDPQAKSVAVHSVEPGEDDDQVTTLEYDWLIVAAGSTHSYSGHDDWEALAPGLKTIEDATEIRGRIFSAFEAAEQEPDPQRRTDDLCDCGRWSNRR